MSETAGTEESENEASFATTTESDGLSEPGADIPPPKFEGGFDPIRDYFVRIWQILFHPRKFFRQLSQRSVLNEPVAFSLAFALITHWIGAAFLYLWRISFEGIFGTAIRKFSRFYRSTMGVDYFGFGSSPTVADRIIHWFWDTSPVLLDPFFTLGLILFHALWIYVAARIFVTPGLVRTGGSNDSHPRHPAEISYGAATKVVCYSMTPYILNLLPVVGGWSVSFLTVLYTLIGVKEYYQISTGRAFVITLFPKLIFFGIIIVGSIFFIGTLFKWFLLMFT